MTAPHDTPRTDERHCHADGQGPCLAADCPIARQRPRRCPGAAGPQHPATPRTDERASDGYEEYREQWVQTCEVMGLRYREADAVKFARDCGWDGVTP